MRWCVVVAVASLAACQPQSQPSDANNGISVGFTADTSRAEEVSRAASIPIELSGPSDHPVMLKVRTIGGAATEDDDFVGVDTDLVIPAGDTSAEITVMLVRDQIDEPDESFTVELAHADGASLATARHEITIAANNKLPYVFVESGAGMADEWTSPTIAFRLSEPTTVPVQITYALSGTASASDSTLQPGTVTIAPGELRATLDLDIVDDNIDEPDETLVVTVVSADYAETRVPFAYIHTIVDDELSPSVTFEQNEVVVTEGDAGTQMVELKVHLTAPSAGQITVPFYSGSPSATTPSDYTVLTQSPLVFAPGVTTLSIWVTVAGDTIVEGDEGVGIGFLYPTVVPNTIGAKLGPVMGSGVTIDDDECLGAGVWTLCPDRPIRGDVVIPAINPMSECYANPPLNWIANGQPEPACFVIARNITISDALMTTRPIVLAATETITISGTLDVTGGGAPSLVGAMPPCAPFPTEAADFAGGAGGSFMTSGGNGGAHTSPNAIAGVAAAADALAPTRLRFGCPGQRGGASYTPTTAFGGGGGAVYLVAGSSITLLPNAAITASGRSAFGSYESSAGGSGGGSGGMIYMYAPSITATNAFVSANGGAGSEGATSSAKGQDGGQANPQTPLVPAAGGSGGTGGDGGAGFAQGSPAASGAPATSTNGGGGGGGGAGYIHASQPLTGATVSPAPS